MIKSLTIAAAVVLAAPLQTPKSAARSTTLHVYFIDVEGGQATLFVSPSGESMLVDAGYPGFDGRDANRIASTVKAAGVSQIDYMLVTHYHNDHVGGVPAIASRLPIKTFVDHGPSVETGDQPAALFSAYETVRAKGRHLQVHPGDRVPIAGLDVRVVSANGDVLTGPLAGAGQVNPLCAGSTPKDPDPTENARSVGTVIGYGSFRLLDLGDLTWNKEHDLVCPENRIGTVDVYLTTHHGLAMSGNPVLVQAVRPRVAIMNNGAKKGGQPEAWSTVRTSPGLEDFWQLHTAVDAGRDHNVGEAFIANVDESTANNIHLAAERDGSFVVTNGRNGTSRSYAARH
jgi:beta-lactamase superfamily II metal-dependent hydrolase